MPTRFLRELFLQRLPANVRMVLASADASMTMDKLADMADKVMEVATPNVAAITGTQANPVDSSGFQQLRDEVSRLNDLVASLAIRSRRCSSSRNRQVLSPAPAGPTASNSTPEDELCWYHADGARKCRDPCSWGNDQAGR